LPSQLPQPAAHAGVQTPAVHDGVALMLEQTVPQVPHELGSAATWVSQPLAPLPSQLAKPAAHVGAHTPRTHAVAVALSDEQARPQAPQSSGFEARTVSQPLPLFPSQFAKPAAQEMLQTPPLHEGPPFAAEQTLLHAPQFAVLVLSEVSQPSETSLLQSAKPGLHRMLQAPPEQDGVPLLVEQGLPQAPQLVVLVIVSTSQPFVTFPSQFANPALQAIEQAPALQSGEPFTLEHALPHVPQSEVLVVVATSHPFVTSPSQFPKPAAHAIEQTPPAHAAVPFAPEHAVGQEPQWPVSAMRLTSHPSELLPLQSAKPAAHAMAHVPPAHVGVPFVLEHTVPQSPQWAASLPRLISQPSVALPLQLAKPDVHEIAHVPPAHDREPFTLEQAVAH
jgi:hypothetical protein